MKLKSRKIISMALVFFMMLTILPLAPVTAYAAGPTVTWTNKSFSTTQKLEPNTVLELEGSNVITIGGTVKPDSDEDLYGINGVDGLTIQGNGSLTINIKPTDVVSGNNGYRLSRLKVCGIDASNLTIKGNVTIVINIEGAVHDIEGIGANTVSVEDSANLDITVKNTKEHANATGIFADTWASLTSTGTTDVNVSVNTTTAYKLGDGILVSGLHNEDANNGDLTIKNGTVNVSFDNNARGYGFFGAAIITNTYASDGSLLIENAKVTTTANSDGKQYVAIQECSNTTSTDPTLIVRNSTLNLSGNGLNGGLASWNNGMHLDNSKVTVNGGGHTLQARFLKISGGKEVSLKTSCEYPVWVSPTKGYIEFALTSGGKFTAESTKTSTYDMNYVKLGTDNYVTSGSVDYSRHYNDDLNTGFATADNKKFVVEYQGILSGSAFYTSAVNIGKSVNVNHTGVIASIDKNELNYQWQISNNGTSGWTDIDDATTNPWTIPADDSYLGKYIRVVVTADGYRGSVISPAAQITKQSNRHEVPETPELDKNAEGTAITITNYQADQEYVVSTSSTPDWANNTKSNGNKFEGLATNTTYYVHTRMAETATQQAGIVVRSANIRLAETISLNGIDVVASKYVAASGQVVKISVLPVPGNATGFDGAKLYLNYGAGAKLYTDETCTTEITYSSTYYTTVYLKGTDAETVTISAERSAGSGAPYTDNVKVEIAGSNGAFAFGANEIKLTPNSITIPQGGTAIVELSSMVTSEKPIDTAIWAYSHNTDLNGLTFERIEGTNQFLVKASSDCTVGTGGYKVTVNGTTQTNTLSVTVTGNAIPAESVSVSPESLSLKIGETYDLTATVTPANSTDAIAWSVTSGDSVTVDANGKVTAVKAGTATVTATAGGKSASVTVKVGCATHDWNEWPVTITPTCQQGDLVQTRTCKNCDVTETRVVEAIHFGKDYTYDEFDHWQMCEYGCGTVLKDKAAHTDTDSNNECDICKYDMTPAAVPNVITATVTEVTVSGTTGTAITAKDIYISIYRESGSSEFGFKDPGANTNVSSWFKNLPAGLTATITKIDPAMLKITIAGTPTATSDSVMQIVIPQDAITGAAGDVTVATNDKAKYAITAGSNEYDITVNGGTASVNKAVAGTVITLTVDESAIPAGKVFDKWEVVSGGVTVADGKFTMPANAVEIEATYKDAPVIPTEYDITITGGTASANKAVAGTEITLTVDNSAIPAGKVFDKWEVVSGGATIADGKFTMPANAVEINATYKDKPSSGSSSGGGFSGSYNYPVIVGDTDGADVAVSEDYAVKGEEITITVKPDAGEQVDEVIVTDKDGKVIPVTKTGDNKYTFTMPASKVTVDVATEAADYGLRTVTLKIDGKTMNMTIGKPIPGFGTSAVIMNDRTYVPVRYVMEKLGADVEWINATRQIIIEK